MFFDLSLPEIVVLLGLGVVLFGPDKLPQAAASAARILRQIRAFSDNAREDLRKELGPEFDGLNLEDLNPNSLSVVTAKVEPKIEVKAEDNGFRNAVIRRGLSPEDAAAELSYGVEEDLRSLTQEVTGPGIREMRARTELFGGRSFGTARH